MLTLNCGFDMGTDDEILDYFKDVGTTVSIAEDEYNRHNAEMKKMFENIGLNWVPRPFAECVTGSVVEPVPEDG